VFAHPLRDGRGSVPSRARKQAIMSLRLGNAYGTSEVMKIFSRLEMMLIGAGANEVDTALEQSSPSASLIRNARGYQ